MKLKDYMKLMDITPKAFSRKSELTPTLIYKALNGVSRIDIRTALIIEKMTNGDVSLLELCDDEFQEKYKRIKSPFRKISSK